MNWLQGCYNVAEMDIATVFKIIYIPKNYSNKIKMEKYDYNGKEKFEKTNTVSSIEQFGHALKSRQDKINFFRNDQSTLAKYCLCIYDSKRQELKSTDDLKEELQPLFLTPLEADGEEEKLDLVIPLHDMLTQDDEDSTRVYHLDFDLNKE